MNHDQQRQALASGSSIASTEELGNTTYNSRKLGTEAYNINNNNARCGVNTLIV